MAKRELAAMTPERRETLLRTAAEEFSSAGYEHASLNRIIRSCGMSKSSFYHYVQSKQELFDVTVEGIVTGIGEQLRIPRPTELATPQFWASIEELLERITTLIEREPAFGQLGDMFYASGSPAGEESALARFTTAIETWLDEVLAAGRSAGAVRDDLPADLQARVALAVLRAFDSWSVRHPSELGGSSGRRLARAQLDALHRLLAPS